MSDKTHIIELAADIVMAYVSHNNVDADALPGLIDAVYSQLRDSLSEDNNLPASKPKPAVKIEDSITDDYIICLEDGQHYKSLKRHLRTQYQMTPKEYREKWDLPADYPMVAKNYSKERSRLAKRTGLGKNPDS